MGKVSRVVVVLGGLVGAAMAVAWGLLGPLESGPFLATVGREMGVVAGALAGVLAGALMGAAAGLPADRGLHTGWTEFPSVHYLWAITKYRPPYPSYCGCGPVYLLAYFNQHGDPLVSIRFIS